MLTRRSFQRHCLHAAATAGGALALPGCDLLRNLGAPTPTAELAGVRLQDFSLTGLSLLFDVNIKNPYAVGLPLANLDFALASGGQAFVNGQAPMQGVIPASGQQLVTIPTTVGFAGLLQTLQGVRPGAIVPYHATLGLSVNAPALGVVRLPIEKDGELPVPAVPDVSITHIGWKNLSLTSATGEMRVAIGNTNQFPIDVTNIDYGLQLAGFDVARSSIGIPAHIAPSAGGELALLLNVPIASAGLGLFRALQSGSAPYNFSGTLALGTPFGPLAAPWAKAGTVALTRG
jgi:LEA14-like dessication related protein